MAYIPLEALRFVPSKRASLGDDLDGVLADIPFLAVGILAFCTFTFLAFLKRLGISLTILHLSVVMAFLASISDLSQILQQGNQSSGAGFDVVSQPLIKAREVGYAFSASLRFIFLWMFVAEPPKVERDTPNARAGLHSGNWNALGHIGVVLRWTTLCLTVVVFALQVAWRLGGGGFTNVYIAESAIEAVLSTIFILKILLNCSRCTIVSKGLCMVDYLGFLVSLHLSFGFAIANTMHLKFTETILGRFLQGVNFYILVLSSLLALFMPPWNSEAGRPPPLPPKHSRSSFNTSAPNFSSFSFARPRSVSPKGPTLWDNVFRDSDVFGKVYGNPDSYLGTGPVPPPPTEKPKLDAPRLRTGYVKPISSRYSDPDFLIPLKGIRKSPQDTSPIFGLNGIIRPSTGESPARSPGSVTVTGPNPSSATSDIFRKQEEQDNSSTTLALLQAPPSSSSELSEESAPPSATLEASTVVLSTTRSEFSLSNFPNPPGVTSSDPHYSFEPWPSPSAFLEIEPSRSGPLSIHIDDVTFDLIPPRMPASMADHNRSLSLPISETEDPEAVASARTPRFDSQGTQYDVTSFIGNLTGSPDPATKSLPLGHKKGLSGSSNTTGMTVASSDDPELTATIVTLQQTKQTYVGSPLARVPIVGSATVGGYQATNVFLPSRPKLGISPPQSTPTQRQEDVGPDVFERPRAVPPTPS